MEPSKSRVRTFALVVCGLLMPLLQARAAQFVEVTAELQSIRWVYQGTNTPPSVLTRNWKTRCVVGTNTWLIEGAFPPAQHAWWFTGSNITAHSVITDYPSERKELFQRNHSDMIIGRGYTKILQSADGRPASTPALLAGMAFDPEACVNIPWLAFCSGSYLKQQGRQLPLPSLDYWSYALDYTDKTKVFEDDLGLPQAADYYTAGDQPVCRYRVLDSTNVLGWNFPLRFQLAQYRKGVHNNVWELDLTASGEVTWIAVGGPPEIPTVAQKKVEK